MRYKIFRYCFLLIILSFLIAGCKDSISDVKLPPDNSEKVTIKQGTWGNVWFWEGNFAPYSPHGTITPVVREIYVYYATRYDSVITNQRTGFYDSILTKQITKLWSDNTGFFQLELPPGKYNFFIKEDSCYYATEGDGAGYLLTATVTANSVTKRQIDINYKAVW